MPTPITTIPTNSFPIKITSHGMEIPAKTITRQRSSTSTVRPSPISYHYMIQQQNLSRRYRKRLLNQTHSPNRNAKKSNQYSTVHVSALTNKLYQQVPTQMQQSLFLVCQDLNLKHKLRAGVQLSFMQFHLKNGHRFCWTN